MEYNVNQDGNESSEDSHIEWLSKWLQADIDPQRVENIIEENKRDPSNHITASSWGHNTPAEEFAAIGEILKEEAEKNPTRTLARFLQTTKQTISRGTTLLKSFDEYWRFEPCIKKILEMNTEEIDSADEYFKQFQASSYFHSMNQQTHSFSKDFDDWYTEDELTATINKGIKVYRKASGISERTFPNLLALKRILDGENPDLDVLQEKRFSSVRHELADAQKEPNSAYFDLIVSEFDADLRNGVSHGDIVHDPTQNEIQIPTENTSYLYEEFSDVILKNGLNVSFLIAVPEALVSFKTIAQKHQDITRKDLDL